MLGVKQQPGQRKSMLRTSLVVQWLRLQASTAEGTGLIPGRGSKILHAMQYGKKKKKPFENTACNRFFLNSFIFGCVGSSLLHAGFL